MPCKRASPSAELQYNRGDFDRPWPLCLLRSPSRPAKSTEQPARLFRPHAFDWSGQAPRAAAASPCAAGSEGTEGIPLPQIPAGRIRKSCNDDAAVLALVHAEYPKISSGVGGIDNGGCDAWLRLKRTQMGSTPSSEGVLLRQQLAVPRVLLCRVHSPLAHCGPASGDRWDIAGDSI